MKVPFNKLKFLLVGISALAIMAFTLKPAPQQITTMPPLSPTTTQEVTFRCALRECLRSLFLLPREWTNVTLNLDPRMISEDI